MVNSTRDWLPFGNKRAARRQNQKKMTKRTVHRSMFYNASPGIFQKAEELRNNMTDAEEVLWTHLRKSQLGVRFKAQHPIDKFIVDFYCHNVKLVIEVDGSIHELQKEYDINRSDELNNLGLNVIRFTNEEVLNDIELVIDEIKKSL
jgi:very-short-patch-repair endonuclease